MNTTGYRISDDIVWNSGLNQYTTIETYTETGKKPDVAQAKSKN
jgi:hypothetical protein